MPQRCFRPNLDPPCASLAAELLDAVGVYDGAGCVPKIAVARAERVRPFDPDITRVERERIAALDAVGGQCPIAFAYGVTTEICSIIPKSRVLYV